MIFMAGDFNKSITMTYKEIEIGIPTFEMVEEYIREKRFIISPKKVYQKYVGNGWTTKNHEPLKSLEAAINGCNSFPDIYCDIDGPECYKELLAKQEWIEFSKKVKEYYGFHCQECGTKTKSLHAHHKVYYTRKHKISRLPWEYEMKDMAVYCCDCHKKVHHYEIINTVSDKKTCKGGQVIVCKW